MTGWGPHGTCRPRQCPDCGDPLIHQNHRGPAESSSGFGQRVRTLRRTFDMVDLDHVWLYGKTSLQQLRIIEVKSLGQTMSAAQLRWMPMLNTAIRSIPGLHPASGVYQIEETEGPWLVRRIDQSRPAPIHQLGHWFTHGTEPETVRD